jgi:hypothetical protein
LDEWIAGYPSHRYGRPHANAIDAWRQLAATVYTGPASRRSLIDRVPPLTPQRNAVTPGNVQLAKTWATLLRAADDLGDVDTYRYDLVNVTREVVANYASLVYRDLVDAWEAKDAAAWEQNANRFLQVLDELDELLASRPEFLLGRWLDDARRWGADEQESAKLEWNARRVLTLWGEGPAIDDYARKQWSGMFRGYYRERWSRYLNAVGDSLKRGESFDQETFATDLRTWMARWSDRREAYPTEPRGDSIALSKTLWAKYGDCFKPDAISLTTGKPVSCSHSLPPYPAHLANDGWSSDTNAFWATNITTSPEAWWQVDLESPTTVGRVVVICYYGDERYYGFTVEVSLDGEQWETVADRRDNREPSTAAGYTCPFPPRKVRFIRITQPTNSANIGRHLVEVTAHKE